jgi:deoxyadenosine/deoxycytidine kinase
MGDIRVPDSFFVGLCGNIGVGKSLFAKTLGERLGLEIYYEPVATNPYLEPFYADMRRWAFHLQVYFLGERFRAQKNMNLTGRSFIQDRTIYEDGEIFARVLYDRGEMDKQDFDNYLALFREIVGLLPPPGLLVYLKASPELLLKRIANRGRACESSIPAEYLGQLSSAYDQWIPKIAETCPVMEIDTEAMVYPPNDDILNMVEERIRLEAGKRGVELATTG